MSTHHPHHQTPAADEGHKTWLHVLLGLVIGGVLLSLCCCLPCGYNVYDGWNNMENGIAEELRENEEFQKRLGEYQSVTLNFEAFPPEDHPDALVYTVRGSLGESTLFVEFDDSQLGVVNIQWMALKTSDGELVVLKGDGKDPP